MPPTPPPADSFRSSFSVYVNPDTHKGRSIHHLWDDPQRPRPNTTAPTAAPTSATDRSRRFLRALCRVYLVDYACLRYPLPPACADLQRDVDTFTAAALARLGVGARPSPPGGPRSPPPPAATTTTTTTASAAAADIGPRPTAAPVPAPRPRSTSGRGRAQGHGRAARDTDGDRSRRGEGKGKGAGVVTVDTALRVVQL